MRAQYEGRNTRRWTRHPHFRGNSSQTKADDRDRWPANSVAHHEDIFIAWSDVKILAHTEFEIDKTIPHKLMLTVAPDGYLRRIEKSCER
jgi:hypothetical protein